jgi:hypothetical protein
MKKIILITYLVLLFSSCDHSKSTSNQLELEKVLQDFTEVKLSSIAKQVEYVALDTLSRSFIGMAGKIIVLPNSILISDTHPAHSGLYLFDRHGKFIRQIGQQGQGPGEYFQISDVTVDMQKKLIYVLTNIKETLLEYNFSGDFIKASLPKASTVNVCYFNKQLFYHYPSNLGFFGRGNTYQLTVIDEKGKVIGKFHPMNKQLMEYANPFIEEAAFSISNDKLFYHIPKGDTVYQVTEKGESPYMILNFGKYAFPKDYRWDYENTNKAYSMDKVIIDRAVLAKDYLFVNYRKKQKEGILFYDHEQAFNLGKEDNPGFVDDIDGLGYLSHFFAQDSLLIEAIDADTILSGKTNKYQFSKRITDMKNKLKENSNLVIRIVSIK